MTKCRILWHPLDNVILLYNKFGVFWLLIRQIPGYPAWVQRATDSLLFLFFQLSICQSPSIPEASIPHLCNHSEYRVHDTECEECDSLNSCVIKNYAPPGSVEKNLPANAGDSGSILGSGRSLGEGNGNPLKYSCLGNPMDKGAWQATFQGLQKNRIQPGD